jgi:glycosyltransferase involved in cell wall biosynthesis
MGKKIKLLQVANSLGIGGTERNFQNIASSINKEKFEIYNVGFFDNKNRGKIIKKNKLNSLTCDGNIKKFEHYLKKYSIDVLLIHRAGNYNNNEFKIIKCAKKLKIKLIAEINVFGLYDKSTYNDINLHFHVSNTSILKYMINKKTWDKKDSQINFVIYNGLDLKNIDKNLTKINIEKFKSRYGIKNDDFVISRTARPSMSKWTDLTTIVALLLHNNNKNIIFIFRSIPKEREKIFKKILKNNFINLPVTLDEKDILSIYKISDITFNFSKIGESFGYSIAESMYCATPVISNLTKNKDNAQIELIDNDRNGLIIKGGPIYITKIIKNLTSSKKRMSLESLGENAIIKIKSNYDMERSTRSLETYLLLYLKNSNINNFYSEVRKSTYIHPSLKEMYDYQKSYNRRLLDYQKTYLNMYEKFLDILLILIIKFIDRYEDIFIRLKSKFIL